MLGGTISALASGLSTTKLEGILPLSECTGLCHFCGRRRGSAKECGICPLRWSQAHPL